MIYPARGGPPPATRYVTGGCCPDCYFSVPGSLFFHYRFERTVSTPIQRDELFAETNLCICFHQHFEEVEFTGVRPFVNLDHVFVILQVDGKEYDYSVQGRLNRLERKLTN